MTDKIKKFLSKLPSKDLERIRNLSSKIVANDLAGVDVVKLKGSDNVYRAKKGKLRIIYSVDSQGKVAFLSISRRDDKTYKDY